MESLPNRLRRTLWPPTEPSSRFRRTLLVAARHAFALGRDLAAGELSLRAMSLVYTTMLAVVPALAFAFAVAEVLGIHRQLEPMLLEFLEPIGPQAEVVTANVMGFVDNVDGTLVGVLSIGLLLLTAISMAQKVESSFNFVWRVDRPRSFARRFSEYLSVILVGPMVMAVALTVIASLSSTAVVQWLESAEPIGAWIAHIGDAIPYLMTACSFAFLYMVIPNTKVRLKPALIGGLSAGIVWAATGYLFANLVATSARYLVLYSGFAIVLILMLWLYLSWLILLLGSQLAYYIQNPFHQRLGIRTAPLDNEARERLCLAVMFLVASDYARPGHGWTHESLTSTLRVQRSDVDTILTALAHAGLVAKTSEERLVPGRDPHRITLADIVASVRGGARRDIGPREDWNAAVDAIVDRIDSVIEAELGTRSLGDLVDQHLAGEKTSPVSV